MVGSNGMGKTTLLDNLHPYRIMPYKLRDSKEWSTGSFSYYNQCYGREALKELVFEFSGLLYKSVILIDADNRKQEAYLYTENDQGAWMPYNNATKGGKTGPYDQAVEELIGSPALFFSSAFRSQDARKLSSYPRSEILGIVCELLDIDKTKQQGEKAAKVAGALTAMADDLERQKAPILEQLGTRGDIEERHAQIASAIAQHEVFINGLKSSLEKTEQQAHELELSNAAQALTQKRVEELHQRHSSLQADILQHETAIANSVLAHQDELARLDAALAKAVDESNRDTHALTVEEELEQHAASSDLAAIGVKKQAVEDILSRGEEIEQAAQRVADLEKGLVADRAQLETLRSAKATLESTIASLTKVAANVENSIQQNTATFDQDKMLLASEEKQARVGGQADLAEVASKKQSLEQILSKAEAVNDAVRREAELTALLATERSRLDEMRATAGNLRVRLAELSSAENGIVAARARLEGLQDLASGLNGLDCHGDGKKIVNKGCRLLASAVQAEQQIPAVEKEIHGFEVTLAEAKTISKEYSDLLVAGKALGAQVSAADAELDDVRRTAQLANDLANAVARIGELTVQETTIQSRLAIRLSEISGRLQTVTDRAQAARAELTTQQQETAANLAKASEQLAENEQSCGFFSEQIAETEADLSETRKVANLQPQLAGAAARLAELNAQAIVVADRLSQRSADIARKIAELASRLQARRTACAREKADAVEKWEAGKQALDALLAGLNKKATDTAEEARRLEATLDGNVGQEIAALKEVAVGQAGEIAGAESYLQKLHSDLGNAQGLLTALQQKETDLVRIGAEIANINAEIVNWKTLAKACSNDGIVALELDDAGPAIAAVANDLLRACYGPRFTVRLETQGTKTDGGLKEVFDIIVYDAERNDIKSIRDMSGGEVTYIEDAITRAFNLHNLECSARTYAAVFSDEKDGALDDDRKHEFMAIKRQALRVGKHSREFFITQTPELYLKADARIMLEHGNVRLC